MRRNREDRRFGRILAACLVLNLAAGAVLSLVDVPEWIRSQVRAVPRTALVSYEEATPLPDAVRNPDARWTAPAASEGTEVRRTAARTAEGGAGEGNDPGAGGGEAASAQQAFLSVFGDPSAESTGGGGVIAGADVRSGGGSTSAPRISGPRSGIGDGGSEGRLGRQPLGGSSGVAGRIGPGEGDGGGIERTGRVTISRPEPSAEDESADAGAEVFDRIGQRVRRNEAQIRFCYQERGLKENPELAGTVRIAFYVDGGRVTSAELRSGLSGRGAGATERCIVQTVRGWRFPDVEESVTVPFTFVLTR